jgi:hypothetical protein
MLNYEISLNQSIKKHFEVKNKKKKEHLHCTIIELETFVSNLLDVMEFNYKKESIHKLKKY